MLVDDDSRGREFELSALSPQFFIAAYQPMNDRVALGCLSELVNHLLSTTANPKRANDRFPEGISKFNLDCWVLKIAPR